MLHNFEPSGDYATDCARGRKIAEQVLREMVEKNNPLLLGAYVSSMIVNKRYNGVEIGFCCAIGERAITAA